jgi:NADH-quinone oxidoreductase subunit K
MNVTMQIRPVASIVSRLGVAVMTVVVAAAAVSAEQQNLSVTSAVPQVTRIDERLLNQAVRASLAWRVRRLAAIAVICMLGVMFLDRHVFCRQARTQGMTIGAYFERMVAADPDHDFVVYPDRALRWSYGEFKERVPDLAQGLVEKIREAHKDNPRFIQAYKDFFGLCQASLNPNISRAAVDEMLVQHLLTERLIRTIFENSDFTRRNAIAILMSLELMFNAVNINLVAFNRFVTPTEFIGQVFAIFVIVVAAAEATVGLAIVILIYRNWRSIDADRVNLMKW